MAGKKAFQAGIHAAQRKNFLFSALIQVRKAADCGMMERSGKQGRRYSL